MSGRLYDPIVGRMLSPDKYVQDGTNTQAYNRYSYVMNNPLKYTDPSGWRLAQAPSEPMEPIESKYVGGGGGFSGLIGRGTNLTSWGTTMLSGMFYAPSQQYYMNPVTGSFMFGNKVIDRKDYINKTASGDIRPRSTVKINYDYVYEYKKNDPNTKINERYENISINMSGGIAAEYLWAGSGDGSAKPLVDYTTTTLLVNNDLIKTSGLGDAIRLSLYFGQVTGKKGLIVTNNTIINKDNINIRYNLQLGSTYISLNTTDIGYSSGFNLFGLNIGTGFNLNNGLTFQSSFTNSNKEIFGGNISFKPGGGTIIGLGVLFFPELLPAFKIIIP